MSFLALAALLGACTGDSIVPLDEIAELRTWPAAVEVDPGQAVAFAAWLVRTTGDSVPAGVTWSATSGTIEPSGRFTAPDSPGEVWVVARDATGTGAADTSRVAVRAPDPSVPASIQVTPRITTLHVGATAGLAARVSNAAGVLLDGVDVDWSSTDNGVAAVTDDGVVTGRAEGTARVAAHVPATLLRDTVDVEVGPAPVVSVTVLPGSAAVAVGGSVDFTATPFGPLDEPLAGRSVSWSSSAPAVATIDGAGRATARAPGAATLSAVVEGVEGTAVLTVTDAPPPPPPAVASVEVSPGAVSVPVGGATAFTATPRAADGSALAGRVVTWSVDHPGLASMAGNGTASGLAPGTTSVRATSEGVSGTATLTVTDTTTVVGSVTVVPGAASVQTGAAVSLTATVRDPGGAVLGGVPVAWSSDDPATAAVDGAGMVTGVAAGSSTIRASSGGVEGSATVTVTDAPPPPPPAVASVDVSPGAASVQVGGSTAFAATPRAADGSPLTGRAVTWTVVDGSVASVADDGTASGLAAGTTTVRATAEGVSGSATLTVTDPPPPPPPAVTSVDVSPSSVSLAVGATAALTATPRAADGSALTGRTVAWSTADAAVATVDAAGTVTGVAGGSTTITATVEGVTGTAAATVTAPGGSGLADECQTPGPGWIWCDDFDQDRLASYFEFDDGGGSFQRTAGVGADGSTGMRVQFAAGQVGAGALHLAVGRTPQSYMRPADAGTADYRELYWRLYVRYDPGWIGGGGAKLSRAFIFASPSSWAQAMIAHVWSGGAGDNHLVIDPARGTDAAGTLLTTTYNDFANMTWLGYATSATPLFDAAHVGSWYCVEAHVRLNTAGQSDGVFELWIDDGLEAQRTGLNWLGAFSAYGLNAVYVENYWNSGSPRAQARTIDNFVVSTQRIGC